MPINPQFPFGMPWDPGFRSTPDMKPESDPPPPKPGMPPFWGAPGEVGGPEGPPHWSDPIPPWDGDDYPPGFTPGWQWPPGPQGWHPPLKIPPWPPTGVPGVTKRPHPPPPSPWQWPWNW